MLSLKTRLRDRWGAYSKRNHLFLTPLDITADGRFNVPTNEYVDLMKGMETDCPGKGPGADSSDYCVSAEGKDIVIACRRTQHDESSSASALPDMAWSTDTPLFSLELPESRKDYSNFCALLNHADWKMLTDDSDKGVNCQPSFSPDGNYLLFLSRQRPGFESDKSVLRVAEFAQWKENSAAPCVRQLTADIDISFDSIEWGNQDKDSDDTFVIYSTGQYCACNRIFRLTLHAPDSSPVMLDAMEIMCGDACSVSSPLCVSSYLYYVESSLLKPPELKMCKLVDGDAHLFQPFDCPTSFVACARPDFVADISAESLGPRSLTENRSHQHRFIYCLHPEFINGDVAMPSNVYQHYFIGADGDRVHAWYVPPVTLPADPPSASVPLVVIIHGGPQGAIMNSWHYRWNLASYAAQGYGVLAVNFHGSTGFGQSFVDSITGNWGGRPFDDIVMGVGYICQQYAYLDANRIGALGASYGGYMINWINGHNSDHMFKCLVNHDGVFSLRSMYYSTEELFFTG